MTFADWVSIGTAVCYFLLGTYSIFLHKLYGWTLTLGLIALAGLNLSGLNPHAWIEISKIVARLVIFYSIWKLIQHRDGLRYDEER